jgi:hypothetical protein
MKNMRFVNISKKINGNKINNKMTGALFKRVGVYFTKGFFHSVDIHGFLLYPSSVITGQCFKIRMLI